MKKILFLSCFIFLSCGDSDFSTVDPHTDYKSIINDSIEYQITRKDYHEGEYRIYVDGLYVGRILNQNSDLLHPHKLVLEDAHGEILLTLQDRQRHSFIEYKFINIYGDIVGYLQEDFHFHKTEYDILDQDRNEIGEVENEAHSYGFEFDIENEFDEEEYDFDKSHLDLHDFSLEVRLDYPVIERNWALLISVLMDFLESGEEHNQLRKIEEK